jgi:SPX domain protein involved in polyphosphate accumulation
MKNLGSKTIQKREEFFIQFSEDEFKELGWNENQKFEWKTFDDGSVELKPWVSVDLGDISEFPREVLEMLILESLEKDIPVNQVINNLLKKALDNFDTV